MKLCIFFKIYNGWWRGEWTGGGISSNSHLAERKGVSKGKGKRQKGNDTGKRQKSNDTQAIDKGKRTTQVNDGHDTHDKATLPVL